MKTKVSFVLLSYNQEEYIEQSVLSALQQNYDELEIIIVDDESRDRTFEKIAETVDLAKSPHSVRIIRQPKNVGLAENFNSALRLATGELIVVQAGDDLSESDRVSKLVELWTINEKKADLLYSNVSRVDKNGVLLGVDRSEVEVPTLEEVKSGKFFIAGGMAAAYTRRLFEKYGYLSPNVRTEDYVLTFRAILSGGILHHPDPLVRYRIHENSEMAQRTQDRNRGLHWQKYLFAKEAEAKDRLDSWDLSGHRGFVFRSKLSRRYHSYRLECESITGGFSRRVQCALTAIGTFRPRLAYRILKRDILRSNYSQS